jgi:hypothetical protein
MLHPDSPGEPKLWIGPALAALLLVSFALRAWDAGQGLTANRYSDERFTFKNASAILKHGDWRPRHGFYLSLSYLPQTAVLAASQTLHRATRHPPFSIYADTSDGYSPTAYWLCRMVNASYGVLGLLLLFLVGRRLDSPETGLLAAAILAAFPPHLLSSVQFKPDVLVVLLVTLTFYWTIGAARRPGLARFLLAGFGVGLAVATKYTGIAAALPLTAAVLVGGRRDRRQWAWLLGAGLTAVATFFALNPFPRDLIRLIPRLVHAYAVQGVEENSDHWVVFTRQIEFLIDGHGPLMAALALLGAVGMAGRLLRPAGEDSRERRLGFILVLALLVGYSLLHSLGMTVFRGQNYLPVAPFSSLAAAWAMLELWRALLRRAPWLERPSLAAPLWLALGLALVAAQGTTVYRRVVPTNFKLANETLLATLEPLGLRHVVYERELGLFHPGVRHRRPLVSPLDRFTTVEPRFLDRADVEIFPGGRFSEPSAELYRGRVARLAESQVTVVQSRPFRSRGEPVIVLSHPWALHGNPLELRLRRPEGTSYLVGRLPGELARAEEVVSLVLWVPAESSSRRLAELRLDPGDRPVPMADTGRRLSRFFRTTPRFQLRRHEVRVRIPVKAQDGPRGFGLAVYRWTPLPLSPAGESGS